MTANLPPLQKTSVFTVSAMMHGAYKTILSLERSVRSDPDLKKLIYARILGYLLLHGPSGKARSTVALEIVSCNGEAALLTNGKMYYDLYLCACKALLFLIYHLSEYPQQSKRPRALYLPPVSIYHVRLSTRASPW
jgi:hypothetical protein